MAYWVVDACLYAVLGDVALSLLDCIPLRHASLNSVLVDSTDGVVYATLYAVLVDVALLNVTRSVMLD